VLSRSADDFTNSGSTLFGGAEIIRKHAGGNNRVAAYVSHYVAKYDRGTVTKFVDKLYGKDAPLDEFHCTDSIPNVIAWLKEDVKKHVEAGAAQKVHVMQLAPMIGEWIMKNNAKHMSRRGLSSRGMLGGISNQMMIAMVAAASVAIGFSLGKATR
jgi:phosphoribosylpyrophosphate synthetase